MDSFNEIAKRLAETHDLVSFARKSVPTAGSNCIRIEYFLDNIEAEPREQPQILRRIDHVCGDITIVTKSGYYRFWEKY